MEVAITCGGFGSFFFFFFQAEDGIRDKLVTGVQTCALPISPPRRTTWRRLSRAGASSSPAGIRGVSAGRPPRRAIRTTRGGTPGRFARRPPPPVGRPPPSPPAGAPPPPAAAATARREPTRAPI